jgi:flagellin-like protein
MRENKKGLSPVIATVLLIMLAIILAVIILIWVRSFIGEQVTKDLGAGPEVIDSFCGELSFYIDASYDDSTLSISAQNNGNVPIYGFEVRKKGAFSVKKVADIVFDSETLLSGDTKDANVEVEDSKINKGDSLLVVPVLLGQAESGKKYYTCDGEFGEEIFI